MELRQLEYVVQVIDTGSFTAAAERLGVAQPSVSQGVRALEVELGVALFERLPRGAVPTAAGTALEGPARQALRDAVIARAAVASVTGLEAGALDLVCLPTLAVTPAAGLIGRLRAAHPGVAVRLVQPESAAAVLARVREGSSEVGLTELRHQDARGDLVAHELASQEFVALVPADATTGNDDAPLAVRDLAELPIITAPVGTSTRLQLDEAFAAARRTPRIAVETDHREAIINLVAAGAGVALVPSSVVDPDPPPGTAVRALQPPVRRHIGIVHRDGPRSPAADAFLRLALPSWPQHRRTPRARRR